MNVTAPTTSGTYASFSGTSFATPFVTGGAALMMEWGIIKENDPYLYGEKVKAYMQKGSETAAWIHRVSESAGGIWSTDA